MLKAHKRNPMIFIPGLMGSMGNDIIEGTGNWSFGIARWIYDPFIKKLEEEGYQLNQDLYICYYDWRKSHSKIIKTYLKPLIKQVKEKYPNQKIDLVCHSMGGIVARTYIQASSYEFDIGKLIMIATPNNGSVDAYYLWSTGRLLSNKEGRSFISLIVQGYMWILLGLMNISFGVENLDEIHETFPAIGELLPTQDYGSVLCYEDGEGKWEMVPRSYMRYENHFLNRLNYRVLSLFSRLHGVYNIVGYNFSTPEYLMIDKEKLLNQYEEAVLDPVETLEGDGTITVRSAEIRGAYHYYIEANHRQIVEESFSFIKDIYGIKTREALKGDVSMEDVTLHILLNGELNFIVYKGKAAVIELYEGELNTNYPYIYEKYPQNYKWIVVRNFTRDIYSIKVDNHESKNLHIMLMSEKLQAVEDSKEIRAHQKDFTYTFEIN